MSTIRELARTAAECFETARRDESDEDSTYYRVRDGSPPWVKQIVYRAHGAEHDGTPSFLPDDYRYQWTSEALEAIADTDEDGDLDDAAAEFADGVDVYTGRLIEWVGTNLQRTGYVDEAAEETGTVGFAEGLMAGQANERREVFDLVRAALEELAGDDDDDDDEPEPCPQCGGTGQRSTARTANGAELERHERSGTPCDACGGSGVAAE